MASWFALLVLLGPQAPLVDRFPVGERVRILDTKGVHAEGKLLGYEEGIFRLERSGGRVEVFPDSPEFRIQVRRTGARRTHEGAAIGVAIGTGAGLVAAGVVDKESDAQDPEFAYILLGGAGAVAGAILGAAVGALVRKEVWVDVLVPSPPPGTGPGSPPVGLSIRLSHRW